ncbi:MAG: GTPase/DUF3482 domain-containing protein [Alysiella sp.]|uniref:GTPase/DUF3482 domain-containing protein n=1 Tax=Alysiella sp. TaxID=1872483 RepID=UPI0026DAC908|nr:GTPase/DUF3482 domain-containing protein [Alysiella sp.]MDO4433733.1 GTPase/DUF3482 domain-containing protein [Alysiella sp.]
MKQALALSVVGHTNTGKTSLMRTLLRDSNFGEVKNAAATTRHVEEAAISDDDVPLVLLYDTPGLEDAGGVLDWLENETSTQLDGIERLQQFLVSNAAKNGFSQEAKVLRQVLNSDMALYVVDAREPVLPKYRDELTVLSWCAKPIVPVFNFTAEQDLGDWQTMLARRGLHVWCSFDTVAFDFESEIRLWNNLATMLPERNVLDKLAQIRRREWQKLDEQARLAIAHFLLNVAACRKSCDADKEEQIMLLQHQMQNDVRQLEHQLHQQLLSLYRFYHNALDASDWALQAFYQSPFDSDLLKQYGIRTGKGAAAGALIGLGLDALTLGTSLGTASAIGGLIGGIVPNWQTLSDKIKGIATLHIDAPTLTLLAARNLDLLAALQKRGHAAQNEITLHSNQTPWSANRLPESLNQARHQAKWSQLNGENPVVAEQARHVTAKELVKHLHLPQFQ